MPINIEYRPNALLTTWGAYRGGRAAGKRENAQMQLQQSMQNQRIVADTFNNVTGQMFSMARQQQDFRNRQTLNQDAYNFAIGQMDHGAQIDARQFAERSIGEPWDVIEYNAAQQGKIPTDYISGRIAEQQEFQKQSWLAAHNAEEGLPDDYGQQLNSLAQQEAEAEIKFGTGEISPQEYDTTIGAIGAERQRVMNKKVIKMKQPMYRVMGPNGAPVAEFSPQQAYVDPSGSVWSVDRSGAIRRDEPATDQSWTARQYFDDVQSGDANRMKKWDVYGPDGKSIGTFVPEGLKFVPTRKDDVATEIQQTKAKAADELQKDKMAHEAGIKAMDVLKATAGEGVPPSSEDLINAYQAAKQAANQPWIGKSEWAYEASPYSSAPAASTQPSAVDNEEWGPVTIEKGYRIQRSTSGKVRVLN